MSSSPLVSICIPSYNHARFLPEALDSALTQTYPNVEIILADDGSTDESLQVAHAYRVKYRTRIQIFTHPNNKHKGISATVNLALSKAKGTYWTGLSSDDVFYNKKVEQQVRFLEDHPGTELVYSYAQVTDQDSTLRPWLCGVDISTASDPLRAIIKGNKIPGMTVLASRAALERVGPHDESLLYSDWEFWIRCVAQLKVGFIPQALSLYRTHNANTSLNCDMENDLSHKLAVLLALKSKGPQIGGRLGAEEIQKALCNEIGRVHLDLYYVTANKGQLSKAAKHLLNACKLSPRVLFRARRMLSIVRYSILGALSPVRSIPELKRQLEPGPLETCSQAPFYH